ncbi:unnamed protein product [Caenorhabditis bovis]|uniref:MARVEL domain-containing protein n=1 Tax=Caenorhabditis bovis TaxID=2654633 RepID=A0A8S1F2D5_9PELO|nr:unnamed protein product [Caenorhabditis bovis]
MPIPGDLRISIFKYPIGFIRIVQFVFIVIAIAAVNSWGIEMHYSCKVGNLTNYLSQKVSTFSLTGLKIHDCQNGTRPIWENDDSASGSAGFFYFVNVSALIYVLIITFGYVILWNLYQSDKRLPLADLGLTALFFVLFIFCSSIWWAGANTIGNATSDDHLKQLFSQNEWANQNATYSNRDVNNGKLAISVLADWVCVFCFAFNCWIIWKEVVPRDSSHPTDIA